MNGASPIPFSRTDLERQRLESTLDHDLSTLSLGASNPSTSFASHSSVSTLGVPRSAAVHDYRPTLTFDETPRRPGRHPSFAASFASAGIGASPTSTDGHHVSAATLGASVFNTNANTHARRGETAGAGEFDPDRSLGRLVGQLTRAMEEERIINKPASPFRSTPPRSPSPPQQQLPNLSFSLGRHDPLPSPPQSRTVSAASSKSSGSGSGSGSGSNRAATALKEAAQTQRYDASLRRPLADIVRPNEYETAAAEQDAQPERPYKKGAYKAPYLVPVVQPSLLQPSPDRRGNRTYDLTGMTGLLATPAKGLGFDEIDKNAAPATAGAGVPSALASLQAHIRALQNENGVANHRIAELETEVARAREEVAEMQAGADARLAEVVGEKAALEELVASLRSHLARLSAELEMQKAALADLRHSRDTDVRGDLAAIKGDIERLSRDIARLNEVAEQGLLARSTARSQRSMRVEALDLADEVARVSADVGAREARESRATQTESHLPSQLRQGIHAAGAPNITLLPPSAKATRVVSDSEDDREGDITRSPTPSRRPGSRASQQADAFRPISRQSSASLQRSPPLDAFRPARSPPVDAFRPAREPAPVPEEEDEQPEHATMIYVPETRDGPSPAAQRAERERERERDREHRSRRERSSRDAVAHTHDVTPNMSGSSSRSRRNEGPRSPFPSIRAEDEVSFFSPRASPRTSPRASPHVSREEVRRSSRLAPEVVAPVAGSRVSSGASARHSRVPSGSTLVGSRVPSGSAPAPTSRVTSGSRSPTHHAAGPTPTAHPSSRPTHAGAPTVRAILAGADVPPATVLSRVIAELEADFAHYKSIYVELADQYRVLDAASAVAKRHVLAAHLKEVIDCLEHKADQVAALYSLMSVHDRPAAAVPEHRAVRSVRELWAGVRDVLGEEAVRRLEADGLFRHGHPQY